MTDIIGAAAPAIRRTTRASGITTLHLEPATSVTLAPADVARVAQLARLIESTHFPSAHYCTDQILGLRSIATELRTMVGLPAEDPLMPLED